MTINPILNKLINLDERITVIEETMATKTDINNIMDKLDFLIKQMLEMRQENVVRNHRFDKLENRVSIVEKKIGI